MQIHFFSDVLVAVASLDLYSPNVEESWLLQTCEGRYVVEMLLLPLLVENGLKLTQEAD